MGEITGSLVFFQSASVAHTVKLPFLTTSICRLVGSFSISRLNYFRVFLFPGITEQGGAHWVAPGTAGHRLRAQSYGGRWADATGLRRSNLASAERHLCISQCS